jgi:Spy/CpxP family protein refolding chaperone
MRRIAMVMLGMGMLAATPAVSHARPGGHGAKLLEALRRDAGLDDAQAAKVKALVEADRDARKKAHGEMKAATEALEALVKANSADEGAYQAQLEKLAGARREVHALREREIEGMKSILRPSQQARVVLGMKHRARERMEPQNGE